MLSSDLEMATSGSPRDGLQLPSLGDPGGEPLGPVVCQQGVPAVVSCTEPAEVPEPFSSLRSLLVSPHRWTWPPRCLGLSGWLGSR